MRIAFVTTSLDPGGAETALTTLALGLVKAGAQVCVIALRGSGRLVSLLQAGGVPVATLQAVSAGRLALVLPRMAGRLRAFAPDIVHGWMYHGNLVATAAAMASSARLFWSVRQALGAQDRESPMTNRLIRLGSLLSRRPQAIVYNSHQARSDHEKIGYAQARGVVIPNGFDTGTLRPNPDERQRTRARLGIPDESIVIGHLARYHPVKDHLTFLEAASAAADVKCHFIMAGRGVDAANAELAAHVERLALGARLHRLGEIEDVGAFASALDALCVSSRSEAFPNVIAEAMSCGVPCVTTNVGDAAAIVADTGLVVAPGDVGQMAAAFRALARMGPEGRSRRGHQARDRIVQHYSIPAMVDGYMGVFHGSLQGA
jgi:glycosyltransferase involved in cell wall biosynthesis